LGPFEEEMQMSCDFKAAREDQAALLRAIERLRGKLVAAEARVDPSPGDDLRITAELIEAGQSPRGGWSKAQLAILGFPGPLLQGGSRR
jgi:hypothetical protein